MMANGFNPYGMIPCPFCGSGKVTTQEGKCYGAAPLFRGKCEDCGANGPRDMDLLEAIHKWNMRARNGQT